MKRLRVSSGVMHWFHDLNCYMTILALHHTASKSFLFFTFVKRFENFLSDNGMMYGYRKPQQLQLSEEDQVEKARRFEFVQGLLMSTILDDKL